MKVKEFLTNYIKKNESAAGDYMIDYPPFESYEIEHIQKEKGPDALEKAYKSIATQIQKFLESIPSVNIEDKNMVIFVCKGYESFFFDEPPIFIDSFACYKDQLIEKIPQGICLWGGDNRVEHYAYDFNPREEILGMDLFIDSDVSEKDAFNHIISEMMTFAIDDDERNQKISEIVDSLEESVKDIKEKMENGEPCGIPAEDVFRELEQKIWDEADEEQRKQILEEKAKREKNKDRDNAYMMVSSNINHNIKVNTIYKWYLSIIDTLKFS